MELIKAGPTMSSREIADLIEKQHNHIKVSADRLAARGVIGTPAVREFAHNGNSYTEYLFNNATRHLTRLERSIYRDLRKCCRMFTSVASHLRVQDVYSAKPPKACASVTLACTLGFAGVFFGEFMSENLVGICSAGRTVAPVKLAAVQGVLL